jgi:hypothetical protein
MVEEMEALDKNDAWDLEKFLDEKILLVENGCSRRSSMQKEEWRSTRLTY